MTSLNFKIQQMKDYTFGGNYSDFTLLGYTKCATY